MLLPNKLTAVSTLLKTIFAILTNITVKTIITVKIFLLAIKLYNILTDIGVKERKM